MPENEKNRRDATDTNEGGTVYNQKAIRTNCCTFTYTEQRNKSKDREKGIVVMRIFHSWFVSKCITDGMNKLEGHWASGLAAAAWGTGIGRRAHGG